MLVSTDVCSHFPILQYNCPSFWDLHNNRIILILFKSCKHFRRIFLKSLNLELNTGIEIETILRPSASFIAVSKSGLTFPSLDSNSWFPKNQHKLMRPKKTFLCGWLNGEFQTEISAKLNGLKIYVNYIKYSARAEIFVIILWFHLGWDFFIYFHTWV